MGRICPRVSQQWRGYFMSQVYPLLVLELMVLKPPFSSLCYLFRPVDLGRLRARPQPSARDSFPLVTCGFLQRRTKGRPSGRLHSDGQVSQQETPKTLHLRIGAPYMAL